MPRGHLAIVLHAHLPYVRHPEFPSFLEERWLFEAMLECYLPLLQRFRALSRDGIPYRLSMVLSPPLVHMLRDELLVSRFDHHLDALIDLAERESQRLAGDDQNRALASFYTNRFGSLHHLWNECNHDIVGAFADLEERGHLEIMTCGATHGLLPLLATVPQSVRAQVQVATDEHRRHFGRAARGFWLPECGFYPGVDEVLAEAGLRFTVLETHALLDATVPPRFGVYAPLYTPSGVAVFGRDPTSSRQVWSAESGYPGDETYRDFYRDIGFDLPGDQLGDLSHPDGIRLFTGIKYHRIAQQGDRGEKQLYAPEEAAARAVQHAAHFLHSRVEQVRQLAQKMDRPPVVVAPYDAELFGHWWFEGPDFLDALFRAIHADRGVLSTATLADTLREHPTNQVSVPSASTWGAGGYNEVWLEGANSWLVRHLTRGARTMVRLARQNPDATGITQKALQQAARELLLAQSSDWPFIMKTGQAAEFAVRHARVHLCRFTRLARDLDEGNLDAAWIADLHWRDNIFPQIDYEVFA